MQEYELKYGCNPNQKPSRIFLSKYYVAEPDTSTSLMRSMDGSLFVS